MSTWEWIKFFAMLPWDYNLYYNLIFGLFFFICGIDTILKIDGEINLYNILTMGKHIAIKSEKSVEPSYFAGFVIWTFIYFVGPYAVMIGGPLTIMGFIINGVWLFVEKQITHEMSMFGSFKAWLRTLVIYKKRK